MANITDATGVFIFDFANTGKTAQEVIDWLISTTSRRIIKRIFIPFYYRYVWLCRKWQTD